MTMVLFVLHFVLHFSDHEKYVIFQNADWLKPTMQAHMMQSPSSQEEIRKGSNI